MKCSIDVIGLVLISLVISASFVFAQIESQQHNIYISPTPPYADQLMVEKAIHDAIMVWNNDNPNLNIIIVDEKNDSNVTIYYTQNVDGLGTHIKATSMIFDNDSIYVNLGNDNCEGTYYEFSYEIVKYTVAHEIGHYLGLKHTDDENNIMYSNQKISIMSEHAYGGIYDDKGLNIPDLERPKFISDLFDKGTSYFDCE